MTATPNLQLVAPVPSLAGAPYFPRHGLPRKGWTCTGDLDNGPGEPYATCEFCGNPGVRFIFYATHPGVAHQLKVGCVCIERMTEDYVTHRRREKTLMDRASRRFSFVHSPRWKAYGDCNEYRTIDSCRYTVRRIARGEYAGRFSLARDHKTSSYCWLTMHDAKVALFNDLYPAT